MGWKIAMGFLIAYSFAIIEGQRYTDSHPDTYLSITQLAEKYGYPMESHEITTKNGYMLTIFRIPHGRKGSGVNKKPLLMMHGLFGQCENFVMLGMHNASLAYMAADAGYDVWLGNSRGNQHGRKHVSLDPEKEEFWDFSFHEIAVDDLAAMIDYILANTKKENLYYVGHSQGGTVFYILTSERPEYQKKIRMASLLSPASFMSNTTWPLFRNLAYNRKELKRIAKKYDLYEFPYGTILPDTFRAVCINSTFGDLCDLIFEDFTGGRSGELDLKNTLALMIQFLPNSALRQVLHYFQILVSGHFRQWDYDSPSENLRVYGTKEPPDYKIERINIPVAIYTSYGDNICDYKDVQYTCKLLPKCRKSVMMRNPLWSHIDFIFSINAAKELNRPLLRYMDKFS